MTTNLVCSSPSSIDQLHLPVDVVGHLLSVLSSSDIECTRLVCQSWKQAIDHQLTAVRPLHLPQTSDVSFSGCTAVHAPILRFAGQSAAADTAAPVGPRFAWQAPITNLDKFVSSIKNVNELDLSGQSLLYEDCLQKLAQGLTCLRSLKLDACKLTQGSLGQLTAFDTADRTGLTHLSLAGATYGHIGSAKPSAHPQPPSPQSNPAAAAPHAAAAAAAAAAPHAAPTADTSAAAPPDGTSGTVDELLGAIAANPLASLDLSTAVALDRELVASAGQLTRTPPLQQPEPLLVAGRCQLLAPLGNSLQSLRLLGNPLEPTDWQVICNSLTRLTELHMSWDMTAPIFASISQLQRLQSLRIIFQGAHQGAYDPYTLAPLAQTLTSVHLSGSNSLSLLLSLTECSNMQQLQLQGVRGVAGAPELMVQIVHSMPLLRELKLAVIQAPNLQRATGNLLGDYLVQQLDCCCPHLTKLVLPDAPFNGTGMRLAATSAPLASLRPATPAEAAPSSSAPCRVQGLGSAAAGAAAGGDVPAGDDAALCCGGPGQGGLRRLKHLEVNVAGLYCSALPHLSCLTGLESLTLWDMTAARFLHNCRYDCFRFVSALTNLKSFNIPAIAMPWAPAAAAAAAIDGGGAALQPLLGQQQPQQQQQQQGQQGPGIGEAVLGDLAGVDLNQVEGDDAGDEFHPEDEWEDEDEEWTTDEFESASEDAGGISGDGEGDAAAHGPAGGEGGAMGDEAIPQDIHGMIHALQQIVQDVQAAAGPAAAAAALGFEGLEQAVAAQQQPMQQHLQQAFQMGPGLQQVVHNALAAAEEAAPFMLLGQLLPPPQLPQAAAAVGAAADAGVGGNGPAAVLQFIALANHMIQHLQQMALQPGQQQGGQQQQGAVLMGAAPQQLVQGAAAAGAAAGGVVGQGQMALQGALQRPSAEVMEPHLHFLCRLGSLGSLNIGCVITKGPCLMHLSHLTNLQTLVLSGRITLTPASLQLLQKLRLPAVKHLSITECSLDLGSSTKQQQQQQQAVSAAAAAAAAASSSSSQVGVSGTLAGPARGDHKQVQLYAMDAVVPVLPAAFPFCENLKLGSCDQLSIVGLAALLQQLPALQRLWLCGLRDDGQLHAGGVPHNFVSTADTLPGEQQHPRQSRKSHKRLPESLGGWERGYCVPYDTSAGRQQQQRQQARSQLPWELAWFLERGVVIPTKRYGTAPAAATDAAAAAAAAVPAGAVAVPCVAVSGFRYVALVPRDGKPTRVFTRYHDRLQKGSGYSTWNNQSHV